MCSTVRQVITVNNINVDLTCPKYRISDKRVTAHPRSVDKGIQILYDWQSVLVTCTYYAITITAAVTV